MNMSRLQLSVASLLVTALLAACGGGGGGDNQSGEPGVNNPELPTTPGTTVPSGTAVSYTSGSTPALALDTLNEVIGHCGYPRLSSVRDLTKAAQAHVDYIALNGHQGGHEENPSRPGFTGVTFFERIVAAGGSSEIGRAHV